MFLYSKYLHCMALIGIPSLDTAETQVSEKEDCVVTYSVDWPRTPATPNVKFGKGVTRDKRVIIVVQTLGTTNGRG